MSWTPKEYLLKLKGAKHSIIDEYEKMAKSAMANAYAQNAKRPKEKSIYNAEKARQMLERGFNGDVVNIEKQRISRMKNALKGFIPRFSPKGG
jgi:hypothetical protein